MRKSVLWAALALTAVLILPGESWAQRRGGSRGGYRGGYSGGYYSPGWNSGYYRDGYDDYGRSGISIYGVPLTGSRYPSSSYGRSYYYGPTEEYRVPAEEATSN